MSLIQLSAAALICLDDRELAVSDFARLVGRENKDGCELYERSCRLIAARGYGNHCRCVYAVICNSDAQRRNMLLVRCVICIRLVVRRLLWIGKRRFLVRGKSLIKDGRRL